MIGDSKNVNENFGFDGKKASNLTTDAGGLLLSSQLFTNEEAAMRCYQIQQILSQMVGPRGVGFDLPTYLSSHSSNDELFAVAYTMVCCLLLSLLSSQNNNIPPDVMMMMTTLIKGFTKCDG